MAERIGEVMKEINLGPASVCYPDVAIRDEIVHVVAGPVPCQWWRYLTDGTLLAHQQIERGYFPVTDGRITLTHNGAGEYLQWIAGIGFATPILRHARPDGNRPISIARENGIECHQEFGSLDVFCGSVVVKPNGRKPTGIWRTQPNGLPLMADDVRKLWPYAAGTCDEVDGIRVSEGESGIEGEVDGKRFSLWPGRSTKEPRIATEGQDVAIVCWGDQGCWLWLGTRAELAALGVSVTLPPLGRSIEVGYFYRDTSAVQYGGDNPAAPCTVSVIIDPLGLPAEPFEGKPIKMIVDPACLFTMADHPEWWDRWVGVYLTAEGSEVLLERKADTVRMMLERLGLPEKPLLSYTADKIFPNSLGVGDIIGVQAYGHVAGEPNESIYARVAAQLQTVRHRRVALVAQAYDRANPAYWTNDRLAALQPLWWQICREFSNIEYLPLFSDGRKGGTRNNPAMRPWHREMVRLAGG